MKANNSVTVLEALKDPHLFGWLPAFRDLTTWSAWIVFLKATYGLALTRHERKLFEQHTGRATYAPPAGGFPEAVAIVGVQSGKSKVATVLADHAALTGEAGTHAILIGQDHRGSMRVLLRYAKEPFETLDPFKAEVMRNTADPSRAWLVLSWVSIQAEEFAIAPVSVVVWASSEANDIALL